MKVDIEYHTEPNKFIESIANQILKIFKICEQYGSVKSRLEDYLMQLISEGKIHEGIIEEFSNTRCKVAIHRSPCLDDVFYISIKEQNE